MPVVERSTYWPAVHIEPHGSGISVEGVGAFVGARVGACVVVVVTGAAVVVVVDAGADVVVVVVVVAVGADVVVVVDAPGVGAVGGSVGAVVDGLGGIVGAAVGASDSTVINAVILTVPSPPAALALPAAPLQAVSSHDLLVGPQ